MLQQMFNMVCTLLFSKVILNDIPHALLPGSRQEWVDPAWKSLIEFAQRKGEHVPSDYLMWGISAEDRPVVDKYKTVLAGYYLIATERAPDYVIDEVYAILKDGLKRRLPPLPELEQELLRLKRREAVGSANIHDRMIMNYLERVIPILKLFVDGTRSDKVIAIDSLMSYSHEHAAFIDDVLDIKEEQKELFMFEGAPCSVMLLDALAR